jgi:hypothetical protein
VRRRSVRAEVLDASICESLPSSQRRNCSSSCRRVTSARRLVLEAPQVGHRHLCVPAAVRPFFTKLEAHTRQTVEFEALGTTKHAGV